MNLCAGVNFDHLLYLSGLRIIIDGHSLSIGGDHGVRRRHLGGCRSGNRVSVKPVLNRKSQVNLCSTLRSSGGKTSNSKRQGFSF